LFVSSSAVQWFSGTALAPPHPLKNLPPGVIHLPGCFPGQPAAPAPSPKALTAKRVLNVGGGRPKAGVPRRNAGLAARFPLSNQARSILGIFLPWRVLSILLSPPSTKQSPSCPGGYSLNIYTFPLTDRLGPVFTGIPSKRTFSETEARDQI